MNAAGLTKVSSGASLRRKSTKNMVSGPVREAAVQILEKELPLQDLLYVHCKACDADP